MKAETPFTMGYLLGIDVEPDDLSMVPSIRENRCRQVAEFRKAMRLAIRTTIHAGSTAWRRALNDE
jgi:hypothetical protein